MTVPSSSLEDISVLLINWPALSGLFTGAVAAIKVPLLIVSGALTE